MNAVRAIATCSIDSHRTGDGHTVIAISGDLEFATAEHLRQALLKVFANAGTPQIVVDLSHLEFTDSSGIGLFISGHKRAEARGGALALAAVPPNTSAVLRVTGLTRLLPAYATVADAHSALSAGGAACRP